jgi:hypothetical protein
MSKETNDVGLLKKNRRGLKDICHVKRRSNGGLDTEFWLQSMPG